MSLDYSVLHFQDPNFTCLAEKPHLLTCSYAPLERLYPFYEDL